VTLGIPESLNPILEAKLTEAMTEPLPETKEKTFSLSALAPITGLLARKSALAIGPGLSVNADTTKLVQRLVRDAELPMVIDADGLNALAGKLEVFRKRRGPFILTPHPGEMARLAEVSPEDIQQNRMETARNFALDHGVILILKGARSIIASPGGDIFINPTGNPGMASGGMGDVLTGMVGGFLAQGLPPLEAAKLGVYLHGLVGDWVAHKKGERGIMATDLIEGAPHVLRALSAGEDHIGDFFYPLATEVFY
jgi:ADP-dependent NAD(P)H-hydrate dehydratase / NAD(P)H-hydrate epimerase